MGYMKPRGVGNKSSSGTFTLDDLKAEDSGPLWSQHLDEDSGEIYYYNRVSKLSQWERPKNFDGYEIMTGQGAMRGPEQDEYERTFGIKYSKATADVSAKD
jgi:hypothetical protein